MFNSLTTVWRRMAIAVGGLVLTPFLSYGAPPLCQSVFFLNDQQSLAQTVWDTSMAIKPFPEKVPVKGALLDPAILSRIVKKLNYSKTQHSQEMANLPDGVYIYIIDNNSTVAFMNRAAVTADGLLFSEQGFIGTHEGLSVALERPMVLAAGEFSIRGGKVHMLSNGSGTFRGNAVHLNFANHVMSSLGLRIQSDTAILDYSAQNFANPHGTATTQVEQEILIRRNPELSALRAQTREVMKDIPLGSLGDLSRKLIAMGRQFPEKRNVLLLAAQFVVQWKAPLEGEADIIICFLGQGSKEKFFAMLSAIKEAQ